MARKRVLITGAGGYLSRQLLPVFRERYDIVLLDPASHTTSTVLIRQDAAKSPEPRVPRAGLSIQPGDVRLRDN
jgi:nucleoside-diphosphate-sugar epimerase